MILKKGIILRYFLRVHFSALIFLLLFNSGATIEAEPLGTGSSLSLSAEEMEWLKEHPRISVAFDGYYPPYSYLDETGQLYGYAVDIMGLLARRIGIEIETYPAFIWNELYKAGQKREVDVIATLVNNPERHEWFAFTKPYISKPLVAVTRNEYTEIENREDLAGKTIALVEDYHFVKSLLEDFPTAKAYYVDSVLDALLAVSSGDADTAITPSGVGYYYIRKQLLNNLKFATLYSKDSSLECIGVRNDWPILAAIFDKALLSLSEEEKIQLENKWYVGDVIRQPVRKHIELTPSEKNWISEHPVIRVGNEPDYAPFDFQIEGEPAGYSIEFLELLCGKLGLEIEYVQDTWKNLNDLIKNREIDIVHPVLPVPSKHNEYLEFTRPFKKVITCIVINANNEDIKEMKDLEGKKIALAADDGVHDALQSILKNPTYLLEESYEEAIKAVALERADAMVTELSIASYLMKDLSLTNIVIIDEADVQDFRSAEYHIGVRKDWPVLASLLNKAMDVVTPDEMRTLDNNWLHYKQRLNLSAEEKNWLNAHPVIRVGSSDSWAPIEFLHSDGSYKGLSIDYLKEIENMLGIEFEFVREKWMQLISKARNRQLDLFTSVARTPERDGFLIFTDEYLEMPVGVYAKEGVSYISDFELLEGKKVAVAEGYAIHEYLSTNYPEIVLVPVENPEEGIKAVIKGNAFAYIDNILTTGRVISEKGYTHIDMVGEMPYTYQLRMGVRSDWPEFREILQKAINTIPVSRRNSIYNQWVPLVYEEPFDFSLIWKISIAIAAIIGLILYWNRVLAIQVHRRTSELLAKEREYSLIFETATDSIMVMNRDTCYNYCNDRTVEMFGLSSKDEVIGCYPSDFSPPYQPDGQSSDAKSKEKINAVLKGEPQIFEWKHRRKDGTFFDAEVSLILFEKQNENKVAAFVRDISERKSFEEEKRQLGEYYKYIINSMPSLIIGINDRGQITQWNKRTEEYTGKSAKKTLGKNVYSEFPEINKHSDMIAESIGRNEIKHLPRQKSEMNGITHFQDITVVPLVYRKEAGAVIRIDDVTDKVKIEELMVQSEKMLFIGNMAAGMAHEINNPMSALLQITQTLRRRLGEKIMIPANEKAAEEAGIRLDGLKKFMENRRIYAMLDELRNSGERVAGIVENMLSFARKAEGKKTMQDIHSILDKSIELAAGDFDLKKHYDFKSIHIERIYDESLPRVNCEAGKIQQVFLNLLGNGAHAMTGAGIENPTFIIRTRFDEERKMVRIEIEDNGPGIEEKYMNRIFEPFFTTKPAGVGTGLGLSVSYFIITEDHEGEMRVESTPGKGTAFIIGLPIQ